MLSVPPNTVHAFAVVSETARVLNLYIPGGFTERRTSDGLLVRSVMPTTWIKRDVDRALGRNRSRTTLGAP